MKAISFMVTVYQSWFIQSLLTNIKVFHCVSFSPILAPWRGGSLLAARPDFESCSVTKAEYEELGSYRSRRRFMRC
jgi:actin-related protein